MQSAVILWLQRPRTDHDHQEDMFGLRETIRT